MNHFQTAAIVVGLFTALGFISAITAIWRGRTSQGAIAWALSLLIFPYVALPLYWIFGRPKFYGYREALKEIKTKVPPELKALFEKLHRDTPQIEGEYRDLYSLLARLSPLPITFGNSARTLVDGVETYPEMLRAIAGAQHFILLQTYILQDDTIGDKFKRALVERAQSGVKVYLLYDELGSLTLSDSYLEDLEEAGIKVSGFRSTRGFENRLQLNFRNHRRILVVDGLIGFTGGLNIGDSYRRRKTTRDTHVLIEGPAVMSLQAVFAADWYWATREMIDAEWFDGDESRARTSVGNEEILIYPTGPADEEDLCVLGFVHLAMSAKKRLWISTPYFVPEPAFFSALRLTALRGVDVRVMIPLRADHQFMDSAAYIYMPEAISAGVRMFLYKPSFIHQKLLLLDSELASVGSVNLDNRSMRLNFELSAFIRGEKFANHIAEIIERDLSECREVSAEDIGKRSLVRRFNSKLLRLFEPIL